MARRVQVFYYDAHGEICGIKQVRCDPAGTVTSGSGATASRPTGHPVGSMWYDTTLHKPIWYDGSAWRDATGTIV
jgi:hypothetical protein